MLWSGVAARPADDLLEAANFASINFCIVLINFSYYGC